MRRLPDVILRPMRPLLVASLFVFVCVSAIPAMAQTEEVGVPIMKAPYHLPVFTNEYVTVLKIFIPPGRNTGYHIHTEDSVSVNIVPADMTNQNLGSKEVTRGERAQRGRAAYTAYSKDGPRTHKATNVGQTPFHNVSFIFKKRDPGQFKPSSRANVPGYVQIIDNDRVRGWRLVLEPGQSIAAITQTAPGLRIVLDGGELVESVPGSADRGWMLSTGEFYWQDSGVTRGLRNIGTTRIEIEEFEIK
jgi:hypothetical protein